MLQKKKKKKLAALADIGVVIKSEDLKVVFPYECIRSWERFEVKIFHLQKYYTAS